MEKNEIIKRMKELAVEIEKADTDEALGTIETEYRTLNDSLEKLNIQERKRKLISDIGNEDNAGGGINPLQRKQEEQTKETYTVDDKEYRTAWAKALMFKPLDIEERKAINQVNRALDTALTTTATTYIEATDLVDGVNNGGLMIPSSVEDELLKEVFLTSPILNEIKRTKVKGSLGYSYMKRKSKAEWQEEGKENNDGQFELAEFTLTGKEISKTISVTWKVEAMTPESFITYLIGELRDSIAEELANAVIYGTGTNDINGISNTELQANYDEGDNIIDHLVKSVLLIPKNKRMGAIICVSDEVYTNLTLQKNGAGDYVYKQDGNGNIKVGGRYTVTPDPYLQEDDFIIGNVGRYYKMNENETFKMVKDVVGKKRINEYTAYAVIDGNFEPNTLVYGTKN